VTARATPICVGLTALAALWLAGCAPKVVRTRVFDQPNARVELRHTEKGGNVVAHGWAHPATISEIRIAHILANLVFEDADQKRQEVIRSESVYDLAGGIAVALKQAQPDDEVAAAAFATDRRFGIFTDNRVTAFRLHLEGDVMKIEFMAIEAPLEKENQKIGARDYEIPVELPTIDPHFSLVPGPSVTKLGARGVTVAWRDDAFRRPVSLRDRDTGKKRTVLMELPDEPHEKAKPDGAAKSELPPGLSEEQLSALDQVEAARTSGNITEGEYQKRKRLILENKLDEAGYGKSAP
jgi:hypothetical protein